MQPSRGISKQPKLPALTLFAGRGWSRTLWVRNKPTCARLMSAAVLISRLCLGGARFEDLQTPAKEIKIAADAISASGAQQPRLVLQKKGSEGRAYYSVSLRAVSRDLKVAAQSRGFNINRCCDCHHLQFTLNAGRLLASKKTRCSLATTLVSTLTLWHSLVTNSLIAHTAAHLCVVGAKFRLKLSVTNSSTRHHVAVVRTH